MLITAKRTFDCDTKVVDVEAITAHVIRWFKNRERSNSKMMRVPKLMSPPRRSITARQSKQRRVFSPNLFGVRGSTTKMKILKQDERRSPKKQAVIAKILYWSVTSNSVDPFVKGDVIVAWRTLIFKTSSI